MFVYLNHRKTRIERSTNIKSESPDYVVLKSLESELVKEGFIRPLGKVQYVGKVGTRIMTETFMQHQCSPLADCNKAIRVAGL